MICLNYPLKLNLLPQIAARTVVFWGECKLNLLICHLAVFDFGYLSIPFTILWVVGITNAINLIDGLDGLAAGVSSIALIAISIMAIFMGNPFVVIMGSILLVSTIGFLFYNFHPAKIFMGDTGALFLGYMISSFIPFRV